ncbi:hypothetical protein GN244_ATG11296 [Phytophthora infestans]|uniref:Uncharacterized protein n=1 Tax=Phytophthora infestans TaxID=4787 RepID=A0A833WBN6_PHYIN|nr:hypothetical protein GN244_ATG11296 [Phytophthora infestans]
MDAALRPARSTQHGIKCTSIAHSTVAAALEVTSITASYVGCLRPRAAYAPGLEDVALSLEGIVAGKGGIKKGEGISGLCQEF